MASAATREPAKRQQQQGKPAAAAAAAAASAALVCLPDAIHDLIKAYLNVKEMLPVAVACRAMLQPYGRQFRALAVGPNEPRPKAALEGVGGLRRRREMLLRWQYEGPWLLPPEAVNGPRLRPALSALGGLLRRQEGLTRLHVTDQALMPPVADAVLGGALQRLEALCVGDEEGSWSVHLRDPGQASLQRVLRAPRDALPLLKELRVWGRWDAGGFDTLVGALEAGALPRLRRLAIFVNQAETPAHWRMERLVAALEARQALGCPGLCELQLEDYSWVREGPLPLRKRLWAVLMPTATDMERGPYRLGAVGGLAGFIDLANMDEDDDDDGMVEFGGNPVQGLHPLAAHIMQHGAPCLLSLPDGELHRGDALRCLPHLPALRRLRIRNTNPEIANLFAGAVAQAAAEQRPFLPELGELSVTLESAVAGRVLFDALESAGALPRVRKLWIGFAGAGLNPANDVGVALGAALAAGAFPSLAHVTVHCNNDDGLTALLTAMAAAPCAHGLRELNFSSSTLGARGLAALGAAVGAGHFPSLVELRMRYSRLAAAGVPAFAAALAAAGTQSLEVLDLQRSAINEVGLQALAVALAEGRLGSRLRELRLGAPGNRETPGLSDDAAAALADAMTLGTAHVARLRQLYLHLDGQCLQVDRAVVFARRAVIACPLLRRLELREYGREEKQRISVAAAEAAGGRRKVAVVFGTRKCGW